MVFIENLEFDAFKTTNCRLRPHQSVGFLIPYRFGGLAVGTKPCRLMGLFLFLLVVNMHLRRIGLALAAACAGFANACVQALEAFKGFSSRWSPCVWTQPSRYKSKPNRVSQAKRRKYKRQGRG